MANNHPWLSLALSPILRKEKNRITILCTYVFHRLFLFSRENSMTSVNHTNPSSQPQNQKDNRRPNNNLSEKVYSKENSGYQSSASPSSPIACYALWDNISNEQILSRRQNHRRTLMKKKRSNQNKYSPTTMTSQQKSNPS